MKLMSISLEDKEECDYPLIVFNTLPNKRNIMLKEKILTESPYFTITYNNEQLNYTLISTTKKNCGVLRKSKELVDESDQVTMQRIKSHAWKEVQKNKEETKRAVATEHEITERENKKNESKSDIVTGIVLGTIVIVALIILCIGAYIN